MNMKSKTRNKILLLGLLTVGMLFLSIISTRATLLPIIEIDEEKDTFTPSSYDKRDYYVLEPNAYHTSVKYMGKSGTAYYTNTGLSSFSTGSTSVNKDSSPYYKLTSGDLRSGDHPLFDPEPYPRAVRIGSEFDPSFTMVQKDPISLHMDYSFTFRAEAGATYFGLINTGDPFFLDIDISDCNADGSIYFGSAMPNSYTIAYKRMTYPVFPIGGVSIQNFTLVFDDYAVVTLTPHPLSVSEKLVATLDVNTTYTGEVDQGGFYYVDQKTGYMYQPDNDFFSLRLFNISIQKGEYYKVFLDIVDISGTCPDITSFLWGEDYEVVTSSSLNENGLHIKANETENLLLVLFSPGAAHQRYTVTFQNVSPPPPAEVESLTLNQDIELFENTYYAFTLTAPQMIAINWTSSYGFDFYTLDTITGGWNWEENDNWFSPETAFLYGFSVNDIGTNWRYLPAGTYAVKPWSGGVPSGGKIRFTTVPIQQVSNSLQLSVNQASLFALELPSTLSHYYHSVNISTTDHKNESVLYEWGVVGKYNEIVLTATSNRWLGNRELSGSWTAWTYNNTEIHTYRPWQKYYAPILMLRPYDASNTTSAIDTFTASLTVTVTSSQSRGYEIGYIAGSTITGSTSLPVNDDFWVSDFPTYVIPMTLDPYRIYNISAYLIGNYTTGGAKNATFSSISIWGGNLGDVSIYDGIISGFTNTKTWRTTLVLTVSSTTYLYVYVNRAFSGGEYLNSTLQISIEKLADAMDFDLPDLSEDDWDTTVHEKEVVAEDLLATQIEAPELVRRAAPGFEIAFALGTLVILSAVYAKKRRKN